MTRPAMLMLLCVSVALVMSAHLRAEAEAPELPAGATVRFQGTPGSELSAGWHSGAVLVTKAGCTMVAAPDARMPGGRRVLGLLFVEKLERRDGETWVNVPVGALMEKEPKQCRQAVGG